MAQISVIQVQIQKNVDTTQSLKSDFRMNGLKTHCHICLKAHHLNALCPFFSYNQCACYSFQFVIQLPKSSPKLNDSFSVCQRDFLMSQTIRRKQNRNILNKGIFFCYSNYKNILNSIMSVLCSL